MKIHPNRLKIYISDSKISGRGVFAASDISKDEVIEISPIIIVEKNESLLDLTILSNYVYNFPKTNTGCVVALGYASLYNHAGSKSNAGFYVSDDVIVITAIRRIKKDAEITIDYGYSPKKY